MNATPAPQHLPAAHPVAAPGPAGPPPHALGNQGLRLLAIVIDLAIVSVALSLVSAVVGLVVTFGHPTDNSPFYLPLLLALAALFLYSPLLTARCGGTPGKLLCGLHVVRLADARNLSYGAALGRHLAHLGMWLVPLISLLDAVSCLWDRPFRQCLHDKTVGSVVVRRSMRPAPFTSRAGS
ncbi:RDD family protein [Streptomyces inhibens]|nr:RDD family protein [Streptomyces inhibens]